MVRNARTLVADNLDNDGAGSDMSDARVRRR
jgi:hypothetical protein